MLSDQERQRVERMIGFKSFGEFATHLPAEVYLIYHPSLYLYRDFQSWYLAEKMITSHNKMVQRKLESNTYKLKSYIGIQKDLTLQDSLTLFDRNNINSGTFKIGVTGSKPKLNKVEREYMKSLESAARDIGLRTVKQKMSRNSSHTLRGWTKLKTLKTDTGQQALNVEQALLEWLKTALKIKPHLTQSHLPQGGWTETIDASQIGLVTIWNKVLEFSRM